MKTQEIKQESHRDLKSKLSYLVKKCITFNRYNLLCIKYDDILQLMEVHIKQVTYIIHALDCIPKYGIHLPIFLGPE